jgi:hypothetical protein
MNISKVEDFVITFKDKKQEEQYDVKLMVYQA